MTDTDELFKATWKSLEQYECPEWFRDAKFGIWAITGPQAVPLQGDWYARNMYIEGHRQNIHHVKNYGHPSDFGYKDIIKLYQPDKLNFEELASLYKEAGAKYATILAMHHDNFDLWNSTHHAWNSVQKNPGRDLVGEFRTAVTAKGLRFGATTHLARSYNWFQTNKGSDQKGPKTGIPYDGNDEEYASLYHPPFEQDRETTYYPVNPPDSWDRQWYDRLRDLIDQHHPDLLYFDGGYPFNKQAEDNTMNEGSIGRRLVADYYNASRQWHGGENEAAMCIKNIPDGTYGGFREGTCIEDIERGRMTGISPDPWQTDTCIGVWYYEEGRKYRTVEEVVHQLIDIVSKNGNLLLNIPIHPDGSIDELEKQFLKEMGRWMKVNGDAIYGTRPWITYGEGIQEGGGHFNEGKTKYTPSDFRFTAKGQHELNVFFMAWPDNGELLIKSLSPENLPDKEIQGLELLGCSATLEYKSTNQGLLINLPKEQPNAPAWAIKIRRK